MVDRTTTRGPRVSFCIIALAATLIGGCGKKEGAEKAATQVAAKVNSTEVTVHQVNALLARIPNLPAEMAPRAKRDALARLIDQQLAVQQGVAKKLDRSPEVVQAIELARAEIIARAYADSVARAAPKPSEDEVKKYYAEHAELFAQRRIYNIEELTMAPREKLAPTLKERAAKAKDLTEIVTWLRGEKINAAANRAVRAAEQIPLPLLPDMHKMKNGEIRVFENEGRVSVIRVVGTRDAPVDEATAAPRIRQFLANQRASEAVANDMKALKAAAKIEYMGEFAEDLGAAEAKAKADAAARAKAIAEAKAQAQAEARERAETTTKARQAAEARAREESEAKAKAGPQKPTQLQQETIQKGIGGLR